MSGMRSMARYIARRNMERQGLKSVAKHDYTHGLTVGGKRGETTYVQSYFAKHWREFAPKKEEVTEEVSAN